MSPAQAASATAAGLPLTESPARPDDSVPELWTPRTAVLVDASPPLGAESLFDGDATTGFTTHAGGVATVRLELGSAREVIGLGVHGTGRAKIAIYAEDDGARRLISTGRERAINLDSDHWSQLAPARSTKTSALVVQWTASPAAPATVTELALWVAGRSRQALAEAAIADRLVTELPENAIAATAVPWTASVARVTAQGSVSASFTLKLNGEPQLGRAFLVYELDKKAHWTGVARSINGHVVRGGYRANDKGLGGVQVEEINPAWLKSGDNTVSFQPTLIEDGRGYSIHNVRVVSVPRGVDPAPAPGARTPLSDGDLATGVGGPGVHAASISVPADREPAFLSFYLDKATGGTLTASADGGRARHKGQVSVDLDGRPAGWQTVPVAGILPMTSELRVRVAGTRESTGHVSEVRVQGFPALTSPADLAVAYPLHGECQDHKTYVRGFVSGPGVGQKPQFSVDGQPMVGKIDADGSFEADIKEPATAKGKPWSIRLDVATQDGGHRTRTVPVDTCVETPKGRIIGVSPPVEDVGAPYGAVVSAGKASTLSFAGAKIEIPAGAVDSDVRVTMRALDRGQVHPVEAEMDNVTTSGGALRLGPHGLKFKKPVKVTLPIDASRMPAGMNEADVVAFFFDEAGSKWVELPKVLGRPDRVVAETTHFTDFIASTIRMPDHPDGQKFDPNTMKGVKAGEPGAGITLIQPPEANSSGSARLSYPIETPRGRNGIGPTLALTYDSDRVNANGWLGVGWDLRMSSIEIDTRFGAAKYDATDIYSLDGAMLTPIATPSGAPAGGQYFGRRVEGAFDWIQRVGTTGPTAYSWKVTDKSGTVYTYGSVANSRLANPRSGQPGFGNIFRWYLEQVKDPYGNVMAITYQHDTYSTGTAPNVETFDEVYPSVIDYTSNGALAANYHVTFTVDGNLTSNPPTSGPRPDKPINARSGFLVQTRQRLTDITVKSGATIVRQYHFDYLSNLTDTLQKSVLADVALWGPTGASSELYRHTFEYNKAPAATAMFSPQQPWGQVSQAASGGGYVPRTDNGLDHSSDNLIGGAVTLGVGFPEFSATGSFGMDYGNSSPDLAFLGITGEGLPDQIDTAGTLSQNTLHGLQPTDPTHLFATNVSNLTGLGATDRWGWTAGGSVAALGVFGAGASYGRHLSNDRSLVTDINGDGFPDVVWANGSTLNAYLNDGQRGFTAQNWSNYDTSDSPFSTASRVTQAGTANAYFNTDPLLRWVAPFAGPVTISTTATGEASGNIRVDLYIGSDAVRSLMIAGNDTTAHAIVSNLTTTVTAGEKIYARVVSLSNNIRDGAALQTTIAYTPPSGRTASEVDPTGMHVFTFDSVNDTRVAGLPRIPWHLTGDGDIGVARCFSKPTTPDDVKVSYVIRNKDNTIARRFDQTFRAANSPSQTTCFANSVLPPSASDPGMSIITGVSADQTAALEFVSDTPVDPGLFRVVRPDNSFTMMYTRYCRSPAASNACGPPQGQANGTYTVPNDPFPSFPIPAKDIEFGMLAASSMHPYMSTYVWRTFNNGATTQQPIRSQAAPSTSVTFGGSIRTTAALTEDVLVLIQGVNKLHAKVRIPSGTPSGRTFAVTTSACTVTADCEAGRTCSAGQCTGAATLTAGEPVFFTIYSPTTAGESSVTWSPTMNGVAVNSNNINKSIQDPTFDNNAPAGNTSHDPMSGGFHGWFYGDWNDSIPFCDNVAGCAHPIGRVPNTTLPSNADPVIGMFPMDTSDSPVWQGRGGSLFNGENSGDGEMDTGRVNTPIATATSASGMSALRVADTWNVDVTATVAGVTAGGNGGDGTTQIDFLDLNGDHLPDSITRDGVQYNDGIHQTFSPRQPSPNMMFSDSLDLRSILNAGLQAGVSVGGGTNRELVNEAEGDGTTKKVSATVSLSGSADYGVNSTRVDFVDVNGDGLLDHVAQAPDAAKDGNLRVKLNLGYGFSNEIAWTAASWGNHTVLGWPSLPTNVPDPVGSVLNLIPGTPNSTDVVRLQDTGTFSESIGGNVGGVIGGGGGPTWSVTRKWVDLIDVNGDGLPDQVMKIPGDATLHVKLNLGDKFSPDQMWTLPTWAPPGGFDSAFSFMSQDTLEFSTINGWGKNLSVQVCFFVCFGMSGYESDSLGGTSASFEDIDGDGKIDQVMKVPGDPNVYAKLNNIGQTNLLAAVDRPLGGRFTIAYQRSGNIVQWPTVNMPSNQWVMSSVVLNSTTSQSCPVPNGPSANCTTENFSYTDPGRGYPSGYFDPVERENFGYANVKTIFPYEDTGTSIACAYNNQNYYLRGLELSKSWYQDDANQILQREVMDSFWDQSGKDATTQLARTGSYYPSDGQTDTYFAEESGSSVHTFVSRLFDTSGNLTDYVDNGDAANPFDPSDKFNYHVTYAHPGTNITVPSNITIRQGAGVGQMTALLAERTVGTFDPGGKPKTVTDVIVNGKDPFSGTVRTETAPGNATWTFTYDGYGNVKTASSPPPGGTNTNRNLSYTYDATTQTYPITTAETDTDAAYSASALYDFRFGLPTQIIDVTGAEQQIDYDNYGRITKVFAPNDFNASGARINTNAPTIGVSYSEAPHTGGPAFVEALPAWAMATHVSNVPGEQSVPGTTYTAQSLHTVNFVDGLERSIQTKKDITHDDGTGTKTPGMSVSGQTIFDARGRVYLQGQPIFASGTTGNTSFVTVAMNNQTQYAYDVLGRLRQEQHPDNGTQATTNVSYQLAFSPWDGREYVLKMTTDPLYGQDPNYHFRQEFRSVHDEVKLVFQTNTVSNSLMNLYTSYDYDPLGRVVDVIDTNGNITRAAWDTVGNLVSVTSPDAGSHEWRYCTSGFVCAEQTANMIAVGPTSLIKHTYARDRLATTTYPNSSSNATVTYTYGTATQKGSVTTKVGYKANRVTQRTDEAGTFTYDYDGLGDVATETATLINQTGQGTTCPAPIPAGKKCYASYATSYTWDNFGRLIDVTIPGTTSVGTQPETIRYGYDAGGAVASAIGKVGTGAAFHYVDHVGYDEFGSRVLINYGNQAISNYSYYSDTRRLENTSLTAGVPATLTQSLSYYYDLLGNLTGQQQGLPPDTVATDVVPVGGTSNRSFVYDPLNQLIHTDMYDRLAMTKDDAASVDLFYDAIGNLVEKDQTDGGNFYDSSGNWIGSYSGLLNYSVYPNYFGTGPHAASSVDKNNFGNFSTSALTYDSDGNLTSSTVSGTGKFITWSDTDRVRNICNGTASSCAPTAAPPYVTAALYAADGTRTHNKVTQGSTTNETVYVNQYLTLRNGAYPTKHVYLGGARVASRVDSNATVNNTYWYHSDNVQSTQYVTTTTPTGGASLAQHLRYYPGGEVWREQDGTGLLGQVAHETTFSGKELDASGYYYFGARYYDPTVQTWLSPDPILGDYMRGKHNNGVFEPRNLELYSYTWNNPVVLSDPDGRKVRLVPIAHGKKTPSDAEMKRFKRQYDRAKRYLGPGSKLQKLEDLPQTIEIRETHDLEHTQYNHDTKVLRWNPHSAILTMGDETQSPALGVDHEADHAVQDFTHHAQFENDRSIPDPAMHTKEEGRVINGSERSNANRLNEGIRHEHTVKDFYYVPKSTER